MGCFSDPQVLQQRMTKRRNGVSRMALGCWQFNLMHYLWMTKSEICYGRVAGLWELQAIKSHDQLWVNK